MTPTTTLQATQARRLWLLALAMWLLVAAVVGLALWQLRHAALQSQSRELDLLSMALTDEVERGLRGAEEGMQALGLELSQQRLPLAGRDAALALQTRSDLMPLVSTLWLLGRDGVLRAASDTTLPPDGSSFLPELASLPAGATALSRPFAQANAPQQMVALALRRGSPAAAPAGWIVAALPASELLGAFGAALQAADAHMAIFRRDGVQLAGAVLENPLAGDRTAAQRLTERPNLQVRRFHDGSEHLVVLRAVPHYGLQVVVSREVDAMLAGWRGTVRWAVLGMLLLLALTAVGAHLFVRSERQRLAAQRALQEQGARVSRLEALGALAGGVAHDFNNVLAGIIGYGEMAQDAAPPGSDQARHLGKVLQAAQRGNALIERVLAFSRGGARVVTVFELEPVVAEVLGLLQASLRAGVVLEQACEAPGARLRGDATQVFEAVMNLCTNAMQAMPDGGRLRVQIARAPVAGPRVLSHSHLPAGDYLALRVGDQGAGIAPEVMEHLFEPFFTTRSGQSGTGLGLAVVFGVVAEAGGGIDVQSSPGQGACFTLYLPECTQAPTATTAHPQGAPAGAGQRLLVVDDEPELVAMLEEMLRGLGYACDGWTDSRAALQALLAAPAPFAAVITDEWMPGLSGTQLTQALRRSLPDLPVLLVSGHGGALLARRAAAVGVTRMLAKPLQRAELARALQELLR